MRCITLGLIALAVLVGCTREEVNVQDAVVVEGVVTVATPPPAATPPPGETPAAAGDAEPPNDGLYPTVVAATAGSSDGNRWRVDVTLLSEYDSPERYADAWRVLDADDNELGIRVLAHDHANEQPFTRSATIEIPAGITSVFIEGRDQVNGWSGERFELVLDR